MTSGRGALPFPDRVTSSSSSTIRYYTTFSLLVSTTICSKLSVTLISPFSISVLESVKLPKSDLLVTKLISPVVDRVIVIRNL